MFISCEKGNYPLHLNILTDLVGISHLYKSGNCKTFGFEHCRLPKARVKRGADTQRVIRIIVVAVAVIVDFARVIRVV